MATEQTYTISETKIKESLSEQMDFQSINIDDVLKQSLDIKELSGALNNTIDEEPSLYSNS